MEQVRRGGSAYWGEKEDVAIRTREIHRNLPYVLQSEAARHSLGFKDEDLGSLPGWWAATVATYCPSRPGELPKFSSSKPSE